MRTSHKAKDAAGEKQSCACDTCTGHGKAHQPPLELIATIEARFRATDVSLPNT
jgi:hypothetical protein